MKVSYKYEVVHVVGYEGQVEEQIASRLSLGRQLGGFTAVNKDGYLWIIQQLIYKHTKSDL